MKYYMKAFLCHLSCQLSLFESVWIFVFPGQIPLQYAALEKDVAAQENAEESAQSCLEKNALQPPVEIKSSSREQVIVNL